MLFLWIICLLIVSVLFKFYFERKRILKYVEMIPIFENEFPLIGFVYRFVWQNAERKNKFYNIHFLAIHISGFFFNLKYCIINNIIFK